MTIDRIKQISFSSGTGELVLVPVVGYRRFIDEFSLGDSREFEVIIEGYDGSQVFDGNFEISTARLNSNGRIERISAIYSSTGVGHLHSFSSDMLVVSLGVTQRAIERLIDIAIELHNDDPNAHADLLVDTMTFMRVADYSHGIPKQYDSIALVDMQEPTIFIDVEDI
jgi:hypothetical protein